MTYFIETSVIIDFLRGEQSTIQLVQNLEDDIVSSYICLAELYEGVYRVHNKDQIQEVVEDFFTSLSNIYGIDGAIVEKFGELRAQLKKQGQVIEDIDLLIAATCLVYDHTLITANVKHFSHVPNLRVYSP